jgi:hypothetical protein
MKQWHDARFVVFMNKLKAIQLDGRNEQVYGWLENVHRILTETCEKKKISLWSLKIRPDDNIKMSFEEIWCENVKLFCLSQDMATLWR